VDGITYLKVPRLRKENTIDTKANHEKVAKNIARIISPCIPPSDLNIIHLSFLFEYFLGKELAETLFAKVIFTQHITPLESESDSNNFKFDQELFQLADAIVPVTMNGRQSLLERFVPEQKLVTIHNGISPLLFSNIKTESDYVRNKYGLKRDTRLVLYVGRLDIGKGIKYLLEAFSQLIKAQPDCHLVLAGDGNFHEIITHSAPISSYISILGNVPFSDLILLYREATIGVIPSLKEECSYVALEMLHSGLAVVASNIGGLKEIFSHGQDALLVKMVAASDNQYKEAPDVPQLTMYIQQFLTNTSLREQFAANARQKAKEKFADKIMICNYLQLINTHLK
jgi:glycosyltransferase involved in cell wall biosynthesis